MNFPYPSPSLYSPPTALDNLSAPAPVYTILIIGMVLFLASNTMPALLPSPEKVMNVAPMILQWGFALCLLALLTQMTGIIPGVPSVHITYVHLAIAIIIVFLIWNQIIADQHPEAKPSYSYSSSRSSAKEEKKENKKDKTEEKEHEPTPWDDLRAHPSAFLTTRLNRLLLWPFPMGKAARTGNEVWWESGQPTHVGHYNRPDPKVAKVPEDAEKQKKNEKEKEAKEKEKEREKAKAKAAAEKEAAEKKKKIEEMERRKKEGEAMKIKMAEAAKKKAVTDREKQKLWRTKYLAMIIGISLLNKTLGFLLLLFFSIQLVSQELNPQPATSPSTSSATSLSSSSSTNPSSSSKGESASTSSSSSYKPSDEDRVKMARLKAYKALKEREKIEAEGKSSSSPSKPSSSSSRPSSSSSKSDPITSAAVREAAGSETVTPASDSAMSVPYDVGFGMHYIHSADPIKGKLDVEPNHIPSQGMAHPLMTTTWKGYAG